MADLGLKQLFNFSSTWPNRGFNRAHPSSYYALFILLPLADLRFINWTDDRRKAIPNHIIYPVFDRDPETLTFMVKNISPRFGARMFFENVFCLINMHKKHDIMLEWLIACFCLCVCGMTHQPCEKSVFGIGLLSDVLGSAWSPDFDKVRCSWNLFLKK